MTGHAFRLVSMALFCVSVSASAFQLPKGHTSVELGVFNAQQGRSQHIDIQGLTGNDFHVSDGRDRSALIGLSYFIDGAETRLFHLSYGVHGYYFLDSTVTGTITQENLFTNLSYEYDVTHLPIYAALKAEIKNTQSYQVMLNAGIGPNFIRAHNYSEASLDGGITLPDNLFSHETNVTLSGMIGIGVKWNKAFGNNPLECGLQAFYLGQGRLDKNNSQVLTKLKTGTSLAEALICSVSV